MKKGVTKKHDISCLTLLWIDIGISPTSHIMAFVMMIFQGNLTGNPAAR